ncbi:MAG: 16S rRNA processing protein RimM [Tissierellia bacterium]|nr:16S rRNA processing protein RimM [Tissierellia bacterium]
MKEYTKIGEIVTTHGIKGGIKIYPITSDIERFFELGKVYIGKDKVEATVDKVSINKNMVVLSLKEYGNINDVLGFVKSFIYVDDEDRIELPEDYYFYHDLIGSRVYDEERKELGELIDIIETLANDVYVIKNKEKEFMVPAVKEFIIDVDVDNKKLVVKLIEGML